MQITRRGLLIAGAALALFSCTRPRKKDDDAKEVEEVKEEAAETEEEPQPEQIVDELTNYVVYRVDIKHGITGTYEAMTENTQDFGGSYAVITPDSNFSFDINGVPFSGSVSVGEDTKTLYSGVEDYPAKRLLVNGNKFGNVGTVDFEVFLVDSDILVDMTTSDDDGMVFANFYLRKSEQEQE